MSKPFIFTLFGATGDLTQKKVMPALYKLFCENKLNPHFTIIAFSRREWSALDYQNFIRPFLAASSKLDEFLTHISYSNGHFQDAESFSKLSLLIQQKEKELGEAEKLFYFAIQPEFYEVVLFGLSDANLLHSAQSKILVEKPFGHSERSAQALEKTFEEMIKPEQLLRVDHYLAKEGIRSLVARKQNDTVFESILNNNHIAKAYFRIFETIGIEGRGDFYERVGALLDVGQNHLLEMVATLLADPHERDLKKARATALQSLSAKGDVMLGQYEGYQTEKEVEKTSHTETYFKLQLESSLPNWQGIPLSLEAGKAMAEKRADIVLTLKDGTAMTIDIQGSLHGADAYQLILEEAINGLHDYFVSFEEVIAAWHTLDPVIQKRATLEVKKYPRGTNGPTL